MFERAVSLRRKLRRALKMHLFPGKSSSLSRNSDAVIHKAKSDSDVVGLEPTDDGVPQLKYACVRPSDTEVIIRCPSTTVRAAPDIDAISLRELTAKNAPTITVPPETPAPVLADSPRSSPQSSDVPVPSGPSRPSSADTQEFASQVETFQMRKAAITRARSMPLHVSDPMRKLRDSHVRMMHKMAQDEAKANPLSPSSPVVVVNDQSRVFDYLHRRRSPADEEEEEFCNLAVMRTKFHRSQSAL